MERFLPYIIIALMFGAQFPYWYMGDWRRGLYWLSAAVLNFAITV